MKRAPKGVYRLRDIAQTITDAGVRTALENRLERYLDSYASEVNLEHVARQHPEKWARYEQIRAEIHALMQEADELADDLRRAVTPG